MNQKNWIFSSLFILILIASCQDENSTAGSKLVESSLYNVTTDTCTVTLSTILADSVATSGDTISQIGHYNSSLWGDVQSSFCTEYTVTSASLSTELSYQLDSITITLIPTGNYVGDTLTTQHISMHRLKEIVELDKYGYLYNTSSIPYEAEPITTLTFKNQPNRKKEQELRLPDEFGEELLNLMKDDSRILESQENFRNYLKGIAFVADQNDACISGFKVNSSSFCIKLYYTKFADSAIEQTATFTPNSTLNFNKVHQDRNDTPLAALKPGPLEALSSTKTRHQAFIQGMTGMYLKLEFPHLNNLLAIGDMVTIESAILYLYPVEGTYGTTMPLPSSLTMYTANENNVVQDAVTDSYGTSVQNGSLVSDDSKKDGTYYSFDITSYLQNNLGTFGSSRQNLMLMLPNSSYLTTLQGVTFGDVDHPTSNLKLLVIYKIYNEQ